MLDLIKYFCRNFGINYYGNILMETIVTYCHILSCNTLDGLEWLSNNANIYDTN